MHEMMLGAVAAAFGVAALFFLRYWRSSGDRFFLFFALSFFIEAVNRVFLGARTNSSDSQPEYYLIRLISYGLILYAILDKNRRRK